MNRTEASTGPHTPEGTAKLTSPGSWWPVALAPALLVGTVLKPAGYAAIAGVDTTVLAVAVAVGAAVLRLTRSPQFPLGRILPFLLLSLVAVLSLTWSELGSYQSRKARDYFLLTGAVVLCIPVLVRQLRDLRGLIFTWLIAGAIASTAVLLVGGAEALYGRAGVGLSTLGPAYIAAAGLVGCVTAWGERILRWPLALPLTIVAGVAVVAIGSRGPLLAAVAGVMAWALMRGILHGRTAKVGLLLAGAFFYGIRQASEQSISRLFLYEDATRENIWSLARSAFLENPLAGMGFGDFSTISKAEYPHNIFLEVGAEMGIIGLLSVAFLLATAARRVRKNHNLIEVRVLGSIAVVAFVGQQFSSDISNRVFWIAVIPTLMMSRLSPSPGATTRVAAEATSHGSQQLVPAGPSGTPRFGRSVDDSVASAQIGERNAFQPKQLLRGSSAE